MPEILDDTGKIVNVSQAQANAITAERRAKELKDNADTKAETLKKEVTAAASSISTKNLDNAASSAVSSFKDATSTAAGQVAGQVKGGIQSLSSKADAYKGQLNEAKANVEGLINGDTTTLKNMATDMVENAISGLLSKFGAKVEITFGQPDSDGIVLPIASTLSTDTTSADKISGILSLITGLGVGGGNLQNIVTSADPKGLLDAGKKFAEGKIGAFNGADALKGLANTALDAATSKMRSDLGVALAGAKNINKIVNQVSSINPSTGEITHSGTISSTKPNADSDESLAALQQMDSDRRTDLNVLIKKRNEIKQDLEGAKSDLSALTGGKDGAEVLSATQTEQTKRNEYTIRGEEYKSAVSNKIANNSEVGVVQGLSVETQTDIKKTLRDFAPGITEEEMNKVIALSQGDAADESEAIKILIRVSRKSYDACLAIIKSIDSTITNATKPALDIEVFPDPYVIGSYEKAWSKGKNDPVFPYISSVEELQAEIQYITREVESVIVHWSETHTNKNIGSEEINGWHLKADLDGIGYHYVIRRDGSLQRGRPINIVGQHTPGLDDLSIGICFIGGINAPTGTPNAENFLSAQSLTRSQMNTFDHFCRAVYKVFPGMVFNGHSDVDTTGENIDPGFDVPDYVLTRFGKRQS